RGGKASDALRAPVVGAIPLSRITAAGDTQRVPKIDATGCISGRSSSTCVRLPGSDQDVTLKVLATGSVLVVTAGIRRRVTSTLPAMAGLVPAVTVTVGSRASVPVVDST